MEITVKAPGTVVAFQNRMGSTGSIGSTGGILRGLLVIGLLMAAFKLAPPEVAREVGSVVAELRHTPRSGLDDVFDAPRPSRM